MTYLLFQFLQTIESPYNLWYFSGLHKTQKLISSLQVLKIYEIIPVIVLEAWHEGQPCSK